MKPPTLAELRARQKEQGLVALRADDESLPVTPTPIRHAIIAPPAEEEAPAPAPRLVAPIVFGGEVGFICLLPPKHATISSLPPGWMQENWMKPSPWCKFEGQPEHPEFEANLKAWEESQR